MVSDYGIIAIGTLVFIALGVIATCFVGLTPHKQFGLHFYALLFLFFFFCFAYNFHNYLLMSFLEFSSPTHGVQSFAVGFFGSAFLLRK